MIDRCYIEITNTCNLNCHFCPKHTRKKRQLSAEEFDLLTDKIRGKVCFLYFHIMGEPLLHPLLPEFINMAREKGFKTVLTSNGTLLPKAMDLLDTLPHKYSSRSTHTRVMPRESLPVTWTRWWLFNPSSRERNLHSSQTLEPRRKRPGKWRSNGAHRKICPQTLERTTWRLQTCQ